MIWSETIPQSSLSKIQLSSLTSFIPRSVTQLTMLRIQTVLSISGLIHLKPYTKSLFFSATVVLQMVIAIWMVTHPTLSDGLMLRMKFTMSSIITKQLKALRISLLQKPQHKVSRTQNGALMIFIMRLPKVTSQAGIGLSKLCLKKMPPIINLTSSTSLKSGHTLTTHWSQLVKLLWTATQPIIMLRLNKLLSLHPI